MHKNELPFEKMDLHESSEGIKTISVRNDGTFTSSSKQLETIKTNNSEQIIKVTIDDELETERESSGTYAKMLRCFSNRFKHPKDIFIPSAIETIFGLTFAGVSTHFTTEEMEWYSNPFALTSLLILLNLISRSLKVNSKPANLVMQGIRGLLFAGMDNLYRRPIMHEGGHASAALALYENPNPQISLGVLGGGSTLCNTAHPSDLGNQLGAEATKAIVSSAGTGIELLVCACTLIAAQAISDNYSEAKSHLRLSVLVSILSAAYYALSALWTCEPKGHDFCALEERGISPYAAVGFIVGSMLLLQLLLSGISYCCHKAKGNQEAKAQEILDNKDTRLLNEEDYVTPNLGVKEENITTDTDQTDQEFGPDNEEDQTKLRRYRPGSLLAYY